MAAVDPLAALFFAARGVANTIDSSSLAAFQVAINDLKEAVEACEQDQDHLINFGDEGWVVKHPVSCRISGHLFACPFNRSYEDQGVRGTFRITLHDEGGASFDRVEDC